MRPWAVLHIMLMAAACRHSEPFASERGVRTGPLQAGPLVRLTFSAEADLLGSVWDDSLVYSAYLPGGDACLATMAAGGGERAMSCPDTLATDSWAWLDPAVSPGGTWVAYVEERRSRPNAILVAERRLVVAPRDRPGDRTLWIESSFVDANGVRVNAFRSLTWVDDDRLRFVGDSQNFGNTPTRGPVGVYELRRTDGAITRRPGAAPLGWTHDAGFDWVVDADEPQALYRVADDGTRTHVTDVLWAVSALAIAGGRPLVLEIRPPQSPEGMFTTLLQLYDTATGLPVGSIPTGGVPEFMRAVPGRRAVLVQSSATGAPDLWYVEVP